MAASIPDDVMHGCLDDAAGAGGVQNKRSAAGRLLAGWLGPAGWVDGAGGRQYSGGTPARTASPCDVSAAPLPAGPPAPPRAVCDAVRTL